MVETELTKNKELRQWNIWEDYIMYMSIIVQTMTYGYNIILKLQNRNINIFLIYFNRGENIIRSLSNNDAFLKHQFS